MRVGIVQYRGFLGTLFFCLLPVYCEVIAVSIFWVKLIYRLYYVVKLQ